MQIPGVMRTAGAFRDPKCGLVTKQRKEGTVGVGRSDPGKVLGSALVMPGAAGEAPRDVRLEESRRGAQSCPVGGDGGLHETVGKGCGGETTDKQGMKNGNKRAKQEAGSGVWGQ